MPTVLAPIIVSVDGRPTESETTLRRSGAYVVVLTTALPGIPLTVISTFIGAPDTETTIVDLALGMRPDATTQSRVVPRDDVPATHAHDRCLLEHAAALRDALARTKDAHVSVAVSDAALDHAARADHCGFGS